MRYHPDVVPVSDAGVGDGQSEAAESFVSEGGGLQEMGLMCGDGSDTPG